MAPTVFSLISPPDPGRAVAAVAAAVSALREGHAVALPTETVYGLATDRGHAQRLRELKGRAATHALTLHVGDVAAAAAAGRLGPRALRAAARYWPGPLTLVVARSEGSPDSGAADETIGLRVPAHLVTSEILKVCGGAWMTSANRTGEPPLADAAAIATEFGNDLAVVVDDGPRRDAAPSTVLWCAGPQFKVLRAGGLDADELLATTARRVLFVCTGNTCRSPLAAAFARREAAAGLGVPEAALPARGLAIGSAGVAAFQGQPASEGSLLAGAEVGIELASHRSLQLQPADLLDAARIYCLSASHRRQILEAFPDAAPVVDLLDPEGADIADPFGGDLTAYRTARDQIRAAVHARRQELCALAEDS